MQGSLHSQTLKAVQALLPEEDCDYGYDELATLKEHQHVEHDIESAIKCAGCGRVFSPKNKLQTHLKICKIKDKPYACTEEDCISYFR